MTFKKILLLILLFANTIYSNEKSLLDLYFNAMKSYEKFEYSEAKDKLDKLISKTSDFPYSYIMLANINYQESNYEASICNINDYLKLGSKNDNIDDYALLLKAKCFQNLKKYEESIELLNKKNEDRFIFELCKTYYFWGEEKNEINNYYKSLFFLSNIVQRDFNKRLNNFMGLLFIQLYNLTKNINYLNLVSNSYTIQTNVVMDEIILNNYSVLYFKYFDYYFAGIEKQLQNRTSTGNFNNFSENNKIIYYKENMLAYKLFNNAETNIQKGFSIAKLALNYAIQSQNINQIQKINKNLETYNKINNSFLTQYHWLSTFADKSATLPEGNVR